MTPSNRPLLTLYSRMGCHLCEDMHETLLAFRNELHFDVSVVEIDAVPELRARYNTKVPVLALGEQEICHYHLDKVALADALGIELKD
ncbi:MAG: glutaredoxin family protein [Pseudomonadota bacterium]